MLAVAVWGLSVVRRDAGVVDVFWSQFFLLATAVYVAVVSEPGPRALPVLGLVALWALRLSLYLARRNAGRPEDRRYQAIRARNEPGFAWKSLYLVFALQGVLAWIISLPLLAAVASDRPLGWVDALGAGVFVAGLAWEAIADWQLARFHAQSGSADRVLDTGLWRYCRHPNYFGEALLWWGLWLVAAAGGGWWSLVSPVLMTLLLLKVSGVALLERDIGERRPGYRDYVAGTNAFWPGPRRAVRVGRGGEALR